MSEIPALQKLANALNPLPLAAVDGAHQLSITGTVNILGGGSGGTSSTDEATFTTGATAVTPAGFLAGAIGADSTMSMGTGRVGAPKMSGQRIPFTALATPSGGDVMDNTNTAVRVNVVAGGAGGGVSNITVRGSANTDLHVGYASGAGINVDGGAYLPILGTVNTVGGGGGFASAAVYGSPANPVYVIGSENVVGGGGSMGVTQIGAPWSVTGSVNITGSINPVGIFGSVSVTGSVTLGTLPLPITGTVTTVGGGGGGIANLTVRGSANTDLHVGYASGAGVNVDGGAYMPVLFQTGNIPSVAVYGSLVVTGSVNITGSLNPVGVFGSLGALTGSVNITGSLNPVGVFGSVNVLGSVNIGGQPLSITTASFMYSDSTNSAVRVNVVAGGAGGGVSNITVRGSANTDLHVGYASGAGVNVDGGAYMPVLFQSGNIPSFNILGSVNITGSINPVGVFGSVNVLGTTTLGAIPTVWVGGIGADTVNSAIRVNVVAGGAGGGVANLTVVGTANTAFHVGQASTNVNVAWPQMPNVDGAAWMPVHFPSGNIPSVAVYGSMGVANLGGSVGVTQITSPWVVSGSVNITGSINPVGVFGSLGALTGSVNITGSINPVGIFGSAMMAPVVQGTAGTYFHVGYASAAAGAWPNLDGNAWLPVFYPSGFYPTVNVAGTVNNGPIIGSVNITGSINPVGIFGSVSITGSANVSGSLAGLGGVTVVDTRGSLVPTTWIISMAASSQTVVAGSAPANQRINLSSFHLVCDGTAAMQWMSPSGVAISGSMQLLPGAGFGIAGALINSPIVIGSQNSALYIRAVGTVNIGGYAVGWVA